jgi:hypothetical protein
MPRGDWIFNGSEVVQGVFRAAREGSIIAIIDDPDALINNPRPGRDDDELWRVNDRVVPPVGTAVRLTIRRARPDERGPAK